MWVITAAKQMVQYLRKHWPHKQRYFFHKNKILCSRPKPSYVNWKEKKNKKHPIPSLKSYHHDLASMYLYTTKDTTYLAICNTQIFLCYYLWTKIKRESKTANRKLSFRVVCGVNAVRRSLLFNHIGNELACCLSLFARRSRAKPCWTEGWQFYIWN